MTGESRQTGTRKMILFPAGLLSAAYFIGEYDLRGQEIPAYQAWGNILVFAALALLIPPAVKRMARRGRIYCFLSRSEARNLLILAALAAVPRIAWGLAVPPRIESDYGLYVRMGRFYAENNRPEIDNYLLTVAPNTVAYSVLTGLLMRLFGTTASTLVAFTEILHVCNILLLYGTGRKALSAPRAFAVAALFALLPENVMYSNLPGIEAPAMFTLLSGLLLFLCGMERKPAPGAALCCCGAAVLAFSACIRPNAYAVLIAAAAMLLREKEPVKRKSIRLLALLAGAAVVIGAYQVFRGVLFGGEQPAGGLGWSLYEGLDLENGGRWTEEKSRRCIEVISSLSPKEADAVFRKEGLERFAGYSLPEKLRMFLRKGGALWYESRYAAFAMEGSRTINRWIRLADFSWAACMAALTGGMLYRRRNPVRNKAWKTAAPALAVILLTTAWHSIGTSIGRYHYMLIPFVLLAAAALMRNREEKTTKAKEAEE